MPASIHAPTDCAKSSPPYPLALIDWPLSTRCFRRRLSTFRTYSPECPVIWTSTLTSVPKDSTAANTIAAAISAGLNLSRSNARQISRRQRLTARLSNCSFIVGSWVGGENTQRLGHDGNELVAIECVSLRVAQVDPLRLNRFQEPRGRIKPTGH